MLTEYGDYTSLLKDRYGLIAAVDDFAFVSGLRSRTGDFAFYEYYEDRKPKYAIGFRDDRIVPSISIPAQTIRLEGRTFGKLFVVGYLGREDRKTLWLCSCECGALSRKAGKNLLAGTSRSCGCMTGVAMVEVPRAK